MHALSGNFSGVVTGVLTERQRHVCASRCASASKVKVHEHSMTTIPYVRCWRGICPVDLRAADTSSYILSGETVDQLRHAIFWQRPLKPVERGRCTLVPSEPRLSKALPSVEERTIYETLNHLRFWGRCHA